MINLTTYTTESGIELVINTDTGESFATQAGYAAMSGKDKSTISRRCGTVASGVIKIAEMQTSTGLKTVACLPVELIFDWLVDDNPALAKEMGKVGATVFLHKLAGYQVTSTATKPVTVDFNQELLLPMLEQMKQLQARVAELAVNKRELDGLKEGQESFNRAAITHRGCADILISEMENGEADDIQMTSLEFIEEYGIEKRHRRRIALAASYFQRIGTNVDETPTVNGQRVFSLKYLRQAARHVLGL